MQLIALFSLDLPDWIHTVLRVKTVVLIGFLLLVAIAEIEKHRNRDRPERGQDPEGR